jgi:RNA-splicing ligase RtcB
LSIHTATLYELVKDKEQANAMFFNMQVNPNLQYWNEHNFVFKDEDMFYHAKGATPMLDKFVPDNEVGLRLIPLNMSQPIIVARKSDNLDNGLGFAPHGAGRNLSRSAHSKTLEGLSPQEVLEREAAGLDIRSYSGELDTSELPSAYKDATKVMEQIQSFELANMVELIQPYGCIMAGQAPPPPWKIKKQNKTT